MEGMEEKLGAILSDPKMMQQIMSMAQALGQSEPQEAPPPAPALPALPEIDTGMLQKLSGLTRQSGIDGNQKALLNALCPYLSQDRVSKLERAMRAAKIAKLASTFLNAGGLQLITGR